MFDLSEGPPLEFSNENRDLLSSLVDSIGPSQEAFENTCQMQ